MHLGKYYKVEYSSNFEIEELFKPAYQVGLYLQYNISSNIGIQTELSYQRGNIKEKGEEYDPDRSRLNAKFFALNGIYHFRARRRNAMYLLAGVGLGNARWSRFGMVFYQLKCGPGIKMYFQKFLPCVALNLGARFQYFWGNRDNEGSLIHAYYVSFLVGVEL